MSRKDSDYKDSLVFDMSRPDGTLQRLLYSSDSQKLEWKPFFSLDTGHKTAYKYFTENEEKY